MGLRNILREKPLAGIATAVFIIVTAVFVFQRSDGNGGTIEAGSRFYYDLSTGNLVTFVSYDKPPVTLPSGGEGVMAHVYACGDCQTSEHFVAYIEMYTETYKQQLDAEMSDGTVPTEPDGLLVARKPESATENPNWVSIRSPQGKTIVGKDNQRCGDVRSEKCYPHK